MSPSIELVNIDKSFNHKSVIKSVNLKIFKGKSLVIIGRSGSGKSVLLKCLLGILKPNKGKVYIENNDFFHLDIYNKERLLKKFGVTFQGNALFDSLRIWENISFKINQHEDYSTQKLKEKVELTIKLVGLNDSIFYLYPSQISGGMQKRVAIARAIIDEPEFLIFDEPTAGLDPVTGSKINNLIVDNVKRLGSTSITITHDMDSVKKIADNVAMINNGEIIWHGDKESLSVSNNKLLNQFINI